MLNVLSLRYRSSQFWLPALCYSISTGVYNVWGTQLDTIFYNTVNVGQVILILLRLQLKPVKRVFTSNSV